MSAPFEIQVEGGKAQPGLTYVLTMRCRIGASEGTMRAMASGELLLDAVMNHGILLGLCRDKAGRPDLELISATAMEYPRELDVTSLGDAP